MINSIVFSKDRAQQLRLLLDSIKKNAPGIFNINVLYKASNTEFKKGYIKLISENFIPSINWVEETEFKNQTINLLNSDYEYSCFFTDDDIIFKNVNEKVIIDEMQDEETLCFSLRLGANVNKCYTMSCDNVLIPLEKNSVTVKWDWTKHVLDFGYPFSVDAHVFRKKDILPLAKAIGFHNPNMFEGNLQIFDEYPKEKMVSFVHNVMVNSPSNIVNDTHPNRKGEQFGISAEELNKKYLNGEIINYDAIDFTQIHGCHQELSFEFINNHSVNA